MKHPETAYAEGGHLFLQVVLHKLPVLDLLDGHVDELHRLVGLVLLAGLVPEERINGEERFNQQYLTKLCLMYRSEVDFSKLLLKFVTSS